MSDNVVKVLVEQAVGKARYKYALLSLVFSLVFALAYVLSFKLIFAGTSEIDEPHVAVIKLNGAIMEDKPASAREVMQNLHDAMENKNSVGVILSINSPGGSPIQAERIYDEIVRLGADYKDKKIIAVINELGASAAYYVASSVPTIYASKASLVGSIGVTGSGFGFSGVMEKFGVERRVYASGEHKLFLDPFSPKNDDEAKFFKGVLSKVHEEFINRVRLGRGAKLKDGAENQLYSGLIWDGAAAKSLGLIDKIGTIDSAIRDEFSIKKIHVYEQPVPILKALGGYIGASVSQSISDQINFDGIQM